MISAAPHYLLLTESNTEGNFHSGNGDTPSEIQGNGKIATQGGQWRFVLEQVNGSERIEVEDTEPEIRGERLQLLAVVRGLEALDQPSRVTLITSSHYVDRGFRKNLAIWREKDFVWERFGELVPVKNRDLWRRIDRTMQFHEVACKVWHFGLGLSAPETTIVEAPVVCNPQEKEKLYEKTRKGIESWSRSVADRLGAIGFRRAYGCA